MLPKNKSRKYHRLESSKRTFCQLDFELRTLFQYNPKRFNQFSVKKRKLFI